MLVYILGGFLLYGKQFINLWLGLYYEDAWLIASLIMLVYTIPLTQAFTSAVIEAENKVAFKSINYLVLMLLGTVLGYFLAKTHGLFGMLAGSLLGWVLAQSVMNFYYHRILKLDMYRFFKELLNKTGVIVLVIFALGYIVAFIPGEGWINFIVKCAIYTMIYLFLMYSYGMISYEKELLRSSIHLFKKSK
jgi:O-antigen/teichoic acid export membrane protein